MTFIDYLKALPLIWLIPLALIGGAAWFDHKYKNAHWKIRRIKRVS